MEVLISLPNGLMISEDGILTVIILVFQKTPKWYEELRKKGKINLAERFIDNYIFPQIMEEFEDNIVVQENRVFVHLS